MPSPEAQPAPLRAAEGPHPDVQGGGGPQGDGGPVAGDGERLDEYPPSGDGLLHLEVDLVPPGLVVVGQGRLGDGHDRRRQDGQSRDGEKAPVGFPAPDLQRLGHVVVCWSYSPLLLGSPPPSPPADRVAIEAAELRPPAAAETPALAATKPMVRAERISDEGRFMPK